jgi:peptide chain release factor 1
MNVRGAGSIATFREEPGGHRWQRIPPTERRGRVHTSTVTVAVLNVAEPDTAKINIRDVDISTTRGSGPGGQHRNTTDSCVIAKHRPTGITVRIDGRSQHKNRALAINVLASRVVALRAAESNDAANAERRGQVGSGQRGDKVRTYRVRDDTVTDHRTGEKYRLSQWIEGQ